MNNSRRVALKTTGAFATLVSLGIVTQSQAHAAMDRAGFDIKTMADAVKALGALPPTVTRSPWSPPTSPRTAPWCPWAPPARSPTPPRST